MSGGIDAINRIQMSKFWNEGKTSLPACRVLLLFEEHLGVSQLPTSDPSSDLTPQRIIYHHTQAKSNDEK